MSHKTRWILAAAAIFGCGMLARPVLEPEAARAQAPVSPPAQAGRYQLTAEGNTVYFVDTATGRAWSAGAYNPTLKWWPMETPVAPAK